MVKLKDIYTSNELYTILQLLKKLCDTTDENNTEISKIIDDTETSLEDKINGMATAIFTGISQKVETDDLHAKQIEVGDGDDYTLYTNEGKTYTKETQSNKITLVESEPQEGYNAQTIEIYPTNDTLNFKFSGTDAFTAKIEYSFPNITLASIEYVNYMIDNIWKTDRTFEKDLGVIGTLSVGGDLHIFGKSISSPASKGEGTYILQSKVDSNYNLTSLEWVAYNG